MPKPTVLPRWATDLSNNDEPSAGQKSTGWTPGQTGVSDYDNWVKEVTHRWIEWLDTGDVEFVNLDVSGSTTYGGMESVAVTANITTLDPAGTGTTDDFHVVALTPNAHDWVIHRMVNNAGADPEGRELKLVNFGGYRLKIRGSTSTGGTGTNFRFPDSFGTSSNVDIVIAPSGSIVVRHISDVWHVVSMTGCMVKRTFPFPTIGMRVSGNTNLQLSSNLAEMEMPSATSNTAYPFMLPVGSLITDYIVYAKKNSTSADSLSTRIQSATMGAATVNDLGAGVSDSQNTPGYIATLTESPAALIEIQSGYVYWVKVSTVKVGATVDLIQGLVVTAWVYF